MAKGFAIHNAPTDHGGFIPSTQVRSSQQGNLFVRAGDGHFCPKCKVWSTVQPSHNHIIFDGKPVAYVNDILSCGARIQPQQSHVVGDSGGARISRSTQVTSHTPSSNQDLTNNLIGKENQSTRINNIAYYKWWWGELESQKQETVAQEKQTSSENFDAMHNQFAYGTEPIDYEIDPKAWDVEVAFESLPNAIQKSVDNNGDIGKALKKMADGQSMSFEWNGLAFGQDYYRTIMTKEWPLGRLSCIAIGTLKRIGTDHIGNPNFQFTGYLSIKKDRYSWEPDNGFFKNLGIRFMGEAVKAATGKKSPSKVYITEDGIGMPTIYMRKFYFDYMKDGTKTPTLSR